MLFLQEKCSKFYGEVQIPFAYITINKSINTKFFTQYNPFSYRNPIPGTIVDSHITATNKWVMNKLNIHFILNFILNLF